jgi:hypothetical protein
MQSVLVVYVESYSCLQDESLVQDQFNPGHSPSGSQHSNHGNDSKVEEKEKGLHKEEEKGTRKKSDGISHVSLYQRIKWKLSEVWSSFRNFVRNLGQTSILHPPFPEAEEPKFRDTWS